MTPPLYQAVVGGQEFRLLTERELCRLITGGEGLGLLIRREPILATMIPRQEGEQLCLPAPLPR